MARLVHFPSLVLQGFADVGGVDEVGAFEVRDGVGDLECASDGPRALARPVDAVLMRTLV